MKLNIFSLICAASLAATASSACQNATARHTTPGTAEHKNTIHTVSQQTEPTSQAASNGTKTTLKQWKAGTEVSAETVKVYGTERYFSSHAIDDALFERIYGKSFKTDCTVPRTDLRYLHLLHYTSDGKTILGEMICHKDIASSLLDIFRRLYEARYPIERIRLIDDYAADDIQSMDNNNTTCFNFRNISGSKKLSNHSLGKAVDLNPLYNPYVKRRTDGTLKVSPESGRKYADRTKNFEYRIDRNDLAYRLFKQHGFRWGGDYRSLKDYQHFEKP